MPEVLNGETYLAYDGLILVKAMFQEEHEVKSFSDRQVN